MINLNSNENIEALKSFENSSQSLSLSGMGGNTKFFAAPINEEDRVRKLQEKTQMNEPIKILHIDDESIMHRIVSRKVERVFSAINLKFSLVHVTTIEEAIEQLKLTAFDLMISDRYLDQAYTIDAFKRVGEFHSIQPKMKIIGFSGSGETAAVQSFLANGGSSFVSKGGDINALEIELEKIFMIVHP